MLLPLISVAALSVLVVANLKAENEEAHRIPAGLDDAVLLELLDRLCHCVSHARARLL